MNVGGFYVDVVVEGLSWRLVVFVLNKGVLDFLVYDVIGHRGMDVIGALVMAVAGASCRCLA